MEEPEKSVIYLAGDSKSQDSVLPQELHQPEEAGPAKPLLLLGTPPAEKSSILIILLSKPCL